MGEFTRWRGLSWPDREYQTWCFPIAVPALVMQEKEGAAETIFEQDIQRALLSDLPDIDWEEKLESQVRILTNTEDIRTFLRKFSRGKQLSALDYETTGLKPYDISVHDVYTASVASQRLGAISFPMYPEVREEWITFLQSSCPKTAHHLKFEEVWSRTIFKTPVNNWAFCSMEGAHVLDNRRSFCSLKFQAFLRFGWLNWSGDVDSYLRSDEDDANSVNRIREAPMKKLLLYGGKDALLQERLARVQMQELGLL